MLSRLLFVAVAAIALLGCGAASVDAKKSSGASSFLHQIESELSSRIAAASSSAVQHLLADGTPSGKGCLICTLGLAIIEQYAWDTNQTITQAGQSWCTDATSEMPKLAGLCELLIGTDMTKIQNDFENDVSPDVSCRTTLGECTPSQSQCSLFPQWPVPPHSDEYPRVGVKEEWDTKQQHAFYGEVINKFVNVKTVDVELITKHKAAIAHALAQQYSSSKSRHHGVGSADKWLPQPIPDWDSDKYGASFSIRGIQFRGQDCNDADAAIYPGHNAFQGDFDASVDTNCNGIFGTDPATGQPWEQELCEPTPSRGILSIGDSATAHFSLPPSYMTPNGINMTTYSHLIQELVTEADWPQCSWSTAWSNNTECPYSSLNVSSVYQKMFERNRCMHRDYVNAGVNGGSVLNLIQDGPVVPSNYSGPLLALPARYKNDGPSTVFFAMIGNDICHAHGWNGQGYTPNNIFHQKALEEFTYLNTILAPGSHVIIMGYVDGRVLFNTLANHYHPTGATYAEFYDYLNCMETSPCWGWMNSNATVRNASTAQAMEYNQIYQTIIQQNNFTNFDLHYYYLDLEVLIAQWVAGGGNPVTIIEPVDGFHPSQTGNMLIAELMWNYMEENVPDALGLLNPNNDEIVSQFGNQGGYGM